MFSLRKRYYNAGIDLAEADSYWYIGKCIGYDKLEKKFKKLETKWLKKGNYPIPLEIFLEANSRKDTYTFLDRKHERIRYKTLDNFIHKLLNYGKEI